MNMAGVVLAGGQSSRFGRPKMFEIFEGEPLYKKSLKALQGNSLHPIIIATNAELQPNFAEENVVFHIETTLHQGPLFALQNVMQHFPDVEWFVVLASDMPFIDADFTRKMLNQIDDRYEAIVPKQHSKIQPLAAIYRRRTLQILDSVIQQHKRSMKDFLKELKVCYVKFDEECQTFANINTQQDLLEILKKEKK